MPEDSDTSENVYKSLNLLKKKKKKNIAMETMLV